TPEQMKLLQQTVQSTLAPILPSAMVSALQQMMVANDQNKLNDTLQWLSHHNHVQRISGVLLASIKNKQHLFRNVPMDEQFLNHLKNYLDTIGIKDEFVLRGKLEQMQGLPQQDLIQQQSVKSLLLQMVG